MASEPPRIAPRPDGAVRLLHTSDWHLGVTVRGHSRAVDHARAIADLVRIATEAKPDLIVHTGDVFDNSRPPMGEFSRAIQAFRTLADIAPIVVIAGNHDSAGVFDTLAVALEDSVAATVAAGGTHDPALTTTERIRVLARPVRPGHGAVHRYATASGRTLRLAALPFVHANRMLEGFDDFASAGATYADKVRKVIGLLTDAAAADIDRAEDVAVLASHLHLAGASLTSERKVHTGETYAADTAQISDVYQYLAFGHIHLPQVAGGGRARYPGSLIEVDFGEEGETKQTLVVDLEPTRPTVVDPVSHDQGRRLHRLRTTLAALPSHAAKLGDGLVDVTIEADPGTDPDRNEVGGELFDSLAAAVYTTLPDATVVDIRDARRWHAPVDEVESPLYDDESLADIYRSWLTERANDVAAWSDGRAPLVDVADAFVALHDTGDDSALPQPDRLERLLAAMPDLARKVG